MIVLAVQDMSCSHCVASITKALQAADPSAQFDIDLPRQQVRIASSTLDTRALQDALDAAGYRSLLQAQG